jgi:hypothetical protein
MLVEYALFASFAQIASFGFFLDSLKMNILANTTIRTISAVRLNTQCMRKHASLMPIFGVRLASKRSKMSQKLQSLQEETHDLMQESISEEVQNLPEGISQPFNDSLNTALQQIHTLNAKSDHLLAMFPLTSAQQLDAFMEVFLKYRNNKLLLSRAASKQIIDHFTETDKHDNLFKLLCDKYKWSVIPSQDDVALLMEHYSTKSFIGTYKAFSMLMYYSLEPTAAHYLPLIKVLCF